MRTVSKPLPISGWALSNFDGLEFLYEIIKAAIGDERIFCADPRRDFPRPWFCDLAVGYQNKQHFQSPHNSPALSNTFIPQAAVVDYASPPMLEHEVEAGSISYGEPRSRRELKRRFDDREAKLPGSCGRDLFHLKENNVGDKHRPPIRRKLMKNALIGFDVVDEDIGVTDCG